MFRLRLRIGWMLVIVLVVGLGLHARRWPIVRAWVAHTIHGDDGTAWCALAEIYDGGTPSDFEVSVLVGAWEPFVRGDLDPRAHRSFATTYLRALSACPPRPELLEMQCALLAVGFGSDQEPEGLLRATLAQGARGKTRVVRALMGKVRDSRLERLTRRALDIALEAEVPLAGVVSGTSVGPDEPSPASAHVLARLQVSDDALVAALVLAMTRTFAATTGDPGGGEEFRSLWPTAILHLAWSLEAMAGELAQQAGQDRWRGRPWLHVLVGMGMAARPARAEIETVMTAESDLEVRATLGAILLRLDPDHVAAKRACLAPVTGGARFGGSIDLRVSWPADQATWLLAWRRALGALGPTIVPDLATCLRSERPDVRRAALEALAAMGARAAAAAPAVIRCHDQVPAGVAPGSLGISPAWDQTGAALETLAAIAPADPLVQDVAQRACATGRMQEPDVAPHLLAILEHAPALGDDVVEAMLDPRSFDSRRSRLEVAVQLRLLRLLARQSHAAPRILASVQAAIERAGGRCHPDVLLGALALVGHLAPGDARLRGLIESRLPRRVRHAR